MEKEVERKLREMALKIQSGPKETKGPYITDSQIVSGMHAGFPLWFIATSLGIRESQVEKVWLSYARLEPQDIDKNATEVVIALVGERAPALYVKTRKGMSVKKLRRGHTGKRVGRPKTNKVDALFKALTAVIETEIDSLIGDFHAGRKFDIERLEQAGDKAEAEAAILIERTGLNKREAWLLEQKQKAFCKACIAYIDDFNSLECMLRRPVDGLGNLSLAGQEKLANLFGTISEWMRPNPLDDQRAMRGVPVVTVFENDIAFSDLVKFLKR